MSPITIRMNSPKAQVTRTSFHQKYDFSSWVSSWYLGRDPRRCVLFGIDTLRGGGR